MKFIHLADLHIGKIVSNYSMLVDQEYAFAQVLDYVKEHRPDAIIIAGDIYDKMTPPPDAVQVFDRFITSLAAMGLAIMVISGNHDSPERLGFASGIMQDRNVYLYGVFDGGARVVTLCDEYGDVRFHMLPYIRPVDVREKTAAAPAAAASNPTCETVATAPAPAPESAASNHPPEDAAPPESPISNHPPESALPIANISSYQNAIRTVIESSNIDPTARNVLIAHQFFASEGADPERAASEQVMVGGIDRIDTTAGGISTKFDYVALGHLHGPQRVGAEHIRYAGSPLKYSSSECYHNKCALLVELQKKGEISITPLPINPLHDMRRIRGRLDDLLSIEARTGVDVEDYLHVTLTDEGDIYDPYGKLHTVYPNVMTLSFDNSRINADYDFGAFTYAGDYIGAFAGGCDFDTATGDAAAAAAGDTTGDVAAAAGDTTGDVAAAAGAAAAAAATAAGDATGDDATAAASAATASGNASNNAGANIKRKSPQDLFEEFFIAQNGAELTPEQRKAVAVFLSPEEGEPTFTDPKPEEGGHI